MSTLNSPLHKKKACWIRFCVSAVVSLGLAILIIRGLVSNPNLRMSVSNVGVLPSDKNNNNKTTYNIGVRVTNPNSFRGFNYTRVALTLFMLSDNKDATYVGSDEAIKVDYSGGSGSNRTVYYQYHGFKKTFYWNFMVIDYSKSTNSTTLMKLKNQKSWLYAYLYLEYTNKILVWKTKTSINQWLDANIYVTDNLTLKNATRFDMMTDFTYSLGPYGYRSPKAKPR